MIRSALLVAALALVTLSSPAAAQDRAGARLALASQTPWVRGSAPFTIRLDVDRVRQPQQLDMVVTVHRSVRSRSQFERTIDGDLLGASVHTDRVPFETLRFDAGGAIPVSIDLPSLRPGVYPVSVELVDTRTDGPVATLVTHLIRVPDEPVQHPLSVAWVQPYGADPALQPDGTTVLDDATLDDLRTIASKLDDGVPFTVTPTPETVAALATIDDGKTVSALAALLHDHQVVATPFVDLDVSAMVAAGRINDIGRQRLEGDRVLRDTLSISGDNRTWSIDGDVTPDAVRSLTDLGVTRVVVDESSLEPLRSSVTGGLTLSRPFELAGTGDSLVDAVSVDAGLTAHFDESDDVLAAHHLLADLAVLHFDSPGTERGVVVRPPAGWHPSDAMLSTVMADLASSPLLENVTLDHLFASIDPLTDDDETVVREAADSGAPGFGIATSEIDRARAEMDGFASLAGTSNPELRLMDHLVLVSETSDLRASARQSYVDAVFGRVASITSKVRVLGDRTYRLTAREGTIPLTLVNDNPFPVRIGVELTSDKLVFTKSHSTGRENIDGLELQANGTTTEAIPVKARTSGAFPLRVTMRSPDRSLELGRTTFTITSTVASGVGIILSVGAALFLLLWWGSHWRTVRRARRLVAADE